LWPVVHCAMSDYTPSTYTASTYGDRIADAYDDIHPSTDELRYAWPAELDLMARLAGLRLRHRWADWERRRFDASSVRHVSVYGM
jgi:hypothetical protein